VDDTTLAMVIQLVVLYKVTIKLDWLYKVTIKLD